MDGELKLKNIFEFDRLDSGSKQCETGNSLDFEDKEIFETIVNGKGDFKVERIVSNGQITPDDQVYDQDKDEIVFLLQGEARLFFLEDNREVTMNKGSYVFIKARCKHRVTYTSSEPPCVWIAVHGSMLME
jgi:cupin 2 domain-containing protein